MKNSSSQDHFCHFTLVMIIGIDYMLSTPEVSVHQGQDLIYGKIWTKGSYMGNNKRDTVLASQPRKNYPPTNAGKCDF